MPEGAEVKHSVDWLRHHLVEQGEQPCLLSIGASFHFSPPFECEKTGFGGRYKDKAPAGAEALLASAAAKQSWGWGLRVVDVGAKGKFTWWKIIDGAGQPVWMHCTYGMTGGWMKYNEGHRRDYDKHVVAKIAFARGTCAESIEPWTLDGKLVFVDQRRFGTLKFVGEAEHLKKLASLGPDMLSDPPDVLTFAHRLLRSPSKTLAEALMDQHTISGVGNYVKAESLYAAGLSPHREVSDLTSEEMIRLRDSIVHVLSSSYELGGATIATYRDPEGNVGSATSRFVCYGRQHDPAGRTIVAEETKDKRTTWWCPEVQR